MLMLALTSRKCLVISALLGAVSCAHANLIVNGDFETGTLSSWTVIDGGTSSFGISVNNFNPHSGTSAADFFDTVPIDTIEQTIATVVGTTYHISFYLVNNSGAPNQFTAAFGGTSLLMLTDSPSFGYMQFSADVVATGSLTTLAFSGYSGPGTYSLDDVEVTAAQGTIPEPATLALLGIGLIGVAAGRRRKQ